MWAGEFRLLYWPDQATAVPVSSKDVKSYTTVAMPSEPDSYVDENGFTL